MDTTLDPPHLRILAAYLEFFGENNRPAINDWAMTSTVGYNRRSIPPNREDIRDNAQQAPDISSSRDS
jgi:hypothetical protein